MATTVNGAPAQGQRAWVSVVQLLFTAADRGFEEARTDPYRHSTALGAYTAAAAALALLPTDLDFDDGAAPGDMAQLLRAAATAARQHPIQALPFGASQVIAAIDDLIREIPR